jgi:F420-dependent methylenetetrahydromethanopterin dehydrogenase
MESDSEFHRTSAKLMVVGPTLEEGGNTIRGNDNEPKLQMPMSSEESSDDERAPGVLIIDPAKCVGGEKLRKMIKNEDSDVISVGDGPQTKQIEDLEKGTNLKIVSMMP